MRLFPEQLADHLKAGLKPCYLVCGDEPLLRLEACDAIRHTAASQGFTERHLFTLDEQPDWAEIIASAQSLSLFASRQILEIELGEKLPREWPERVQTLLNLLHPDLLLLITGPRPSLAQSKAKWFDALSRTGVYIPVNFPDSRFFPRWMEQRARQHNLRLHPDAVRFLCHAFEGNLLGAAQAMEKLALLGLPAPISLAQVQDNITRQNHFTPFQLLDTLLEGKVNRGQRMLLQLRDEGVEAGMLAWTLGREVELLTRLRLAIDGGQPMGMALEQAKVWQSRQPLYQQALQRLDSAQLQQMLAVMAQLDITIRRLDQEQAWLLLQSLCLGFRHRAALQLVVGA